jgi:hypothetical protein
VGSVIGMFQKSRDVLKGAGNGELTIVARHKKPFSKRMVSDAIQDTFRIRGLGYDCEAGSSSHPVSRPNGFPGDLVVTKESKKGDLARDLKCSLELARRRGEIELTF